MLTAARPELVRVLAAVPLEGRSQLVTMGWGEGASGSAPCLSNPERDLRRAIGGPIAVSLVDLELDPERWHGRFITAIGAITWQRGPIRPCRSGGCGSIAAWSCSGDGSASPCPAAPAPASPACCSPIASYAAPTSNTTASPAATVRAESTSRSCPQCP